MRSGYDTIYRIFTILLVFTVFLHLFMPKEKTVSEQKNVALSTTKICGTPIKDSQIKIDGKYTATLLYFNGNLLVISVVGEELEAGFFAFRSKYLCLNQPIVFSAEWGYAEGRITAIY